MLFRDFLLTINTILVLSIFAQPRIHAILYKSSDIHFNCSSLFHQTVYESYLLSEGDGLVLSCNVCSEYFKDKETWEHGSAKNDLFIQRPETTGGQGLGASDINLSVAPYPTSLEHIRLSNITTSLKSSSNKLSRFPKRITIQVNEGEPLIITCPIRGFIEKPITWLYAPDNFDELMKLIKTAYNYTTIIQHKTPSRYLITTLKQVNFTTLIRETRGRYRIDPAYNIIVAETISVKKTKHKELHNLICIHGDPYSIPNGSDIYPDWSGIIYIDVLPQSSLARILSKLTPVIQIIMPFILALGIFFMIILTLYTERQPKMRLAAKGLVIK
uniref:Ig-like domain-containing protein n=1 Tax=Schistosoma mansoni TaxID=6183 RepID=A0A5K4EEI9_SCHMA